MGLSSDSYITHRFLRDTVFSTFCSWAVLSAPFDQVPPLAGKFSLEKSLELSVWKARNYSFTAIPRLVWSSPGNWNYRHFRFHFCFDYPRRYSFLHLAAFLPLSDRKFWVSCDKHFCQGVLGRPLNKCRPVTAMAGRSFSSVYQKVFFFFSPTFKGTCPQNWWNLWNFDSK